MDRIIEVKVSGNYLSKDNKKAGVRGEANVAKLRITFDEDWDKYAKTVTFWDARGANPVKRTLTTDYLENIEKNTRVYIVPIPKEPMAEAGKMTFVIDGYIEGKRKRSISDTLEVEDAPITDNAGEPTDPTPTQAEQLQVQIDKIIDDVQIAVKSKEYSEEAAEKAAEAEQSALRAEEAVGKTSYIGENGNWYSWDSSIGDFYDTGVKAQPEETVGEKANPLGAEIFNDYENNKAELPYSHVEGRDNIASFKVFLPQSISVADNSVTLDSVAGITVGMKTTLLQIRTTVGNPGISTRENNFIKSITGNKIVFENPMTDYMKNATYPFINDVDSDLVFIVGDGTIGSQVCENRFMASHAEGMFTQAGVVGHSEGFITKAIGVGAHAEGKKTQALQEGAHAEGYMTIADGHYAHAEGTKTEATANYSHAEGFESKATAQHTHAEGYQTVASNRASHAEGHITSATGDYSHSEGSGTKATASCAHAEGINTEASGNYTHAEGYNSVAYLTASHAEGFETRAWENYSHSEGYKTTSGGTASHSEGYCNIANDLGSHAEGRNTTASGEASHAEGRNTKAIGINSHAEGHYTEANGGYTHAEGSYSKANGNFSHAEGDHTEANGSVSHSEGINTQARGAYSHSEGQDSVATGVSSHAEGHITSATGDYSHAEGKSNTASDEASHAEGKSNTASGAYSHAEGNQNEATGLTSHAEGYITKATGDYSHAENHKTQSIGMFSHAEGYETIANGKYSHSQGLRTIATGNSQCVDGKYNIEDTEDKYAHITGGGTSDTKRANIHTLDWEGNAWFAGGITVGADNKEVAFKEDLKGLGGGSSSEWKKICDITTTEEVNGIVATSEEFPDIPKCKEFIIRVIFPKTETALTLGAMYMRINDITSFRLNSTQTSVSYLSETRCHTIIADGLIHTVGIVSNRGFNNFTQDATMLVGNYFIDKPQEFYILLNDTTKAYPVGTQFVIYGKVES